MYCHLKIIILVLHFLILFSCDDDDDDDDDYIESWPSFNDQCPHLQRRRHAGCLVRGGKMTRCCVANTNKVSHQSSAGWGGGGGGGSDTLFPT